MLLTMFQTTNQGAVTQMEECLVEAQDVGISEFPRTTKACIDCKVVKELEDYNRRAKAKDGRQNRCRECDRTGARGRWAVDKPACKDCGLPFTTKERRAICVACHKQKQKVPCPLCGKPKMRPASVCAECCDRSGSNNPAWKGGQTRNTKGYVYVLTPDRGYVAAHHIVMEGIIDRRLVDKENVHHLNGVKDDNRPENLELWSRSQPTGQRVRDKIAWAKELLVLYEPESLA